MTLVVPKARDHHDQNGGFSSGKIMMRFELDFKTVKDRLKIADRL